MMTRYRKNATSGLGAALDAVSPRVKRAFEDTHELLAAQRTPHVLVGGLAVGVHGYQYATQDVDWLVSTGDVFDGTTVLTFKPGVPIRAHDVAIDYLTPEGPPNVIAAMEVALATSANSPKTVVVAGPELLVWMKLKAGRIKDLAAIVELLRSGELDAPAVRRFLLAAGDTKVLTRFETAVQNAVEDE